MIGLDFGPCLDKKTTINGNYAYFLVVDCLQNGVD